MASRQGFAAANIVAAYPDPDTAQKVIADLERHGIDAADISLLGAAAREAAAHPDEPEADESVLGRVAASVAKGSAVGGALGGLLGGLAAMAIPGIGPVLGSAIWAGAIPGALFGSGVGGTVAGISSVPLSEAASLAESVKRGEVLVGVHADEWKEIDRAAEVLSDHRPNRIERFDQDGQRANAA
jgi:hypothetical protein